MDERSGVTRFEIRGALGRGGSGTVVRALDRERGVEVAVKRLHAATAAHEAALRREHRLLRELSHPCIVLPTEIGRDAEGLFLVSPLVEGDGFVEHCRGSWLRLGSTLPQLLSALRHLHERGVAHGDLSPSNVRVQRDGRVRLIDFGLAGRADDVRAPRGGTPGYVAPERLAGGPPTPASDLYSLGRLLAECVPSRAPLASIVVALEGPASARPSASRLERELLPRLGSVAAEPERVLPSGRLVGRDLLCGRVTGELLAGRSVVLEGPSAIGKTALLDAIVDALDGHTVLRAYPRPGSRVPFETLDQLLESLPPDLEVDPELAARLGRHSSAAAAWTGQSSHALRTRAELQARLFGERGEPPIAVDVARVLMAVSSPLLVVDDLQWADSDSRACLIELVERADACVLTAVRPGRQALPFTPIAVPPLPPDAMQTLLRERGVDADTSELIAHEAQGVPGVALLAARFARGERPLDEAVARMVASLPDAQRRVLATLLAAGGPLEPSQLDGDATHALVLHGVVARVGERVDLAHDLLREPIARALGEDWLRAARLERATEPDVAATGRVDAYLALGDLQRAGELARVAARDATDVGALHAAADLWAIAARTDPEARREWGRACVAAGRHEEAAKIWRELELETTGSSRRAHTLARAHALLAARRVGEGSDALRDALGAPAPAWRTLARFLRGPSRERPRLDAQGAELALRNAALAGYFDSLDGVRLALDARSGFGPGTEDLGAWADSLLAFFARFAGMPALSARYRRAAKGWGAHEARPIVAAFPGFLDGYDSLRAGRSSDAVNRFDEALARVQGTEDASSFEVQLVLSLRTSAVIKSQRVQSARAAIARFEAATRRSTDHALHVHVETARALCLTWQGRWEEAVERLARARREWPRRPRTVQHVLIEAYASWPRSMLGDACAAHEDLEEALRGQQVLLASAYGPILLAFAAATELAAHRAGHRGASRTRALARALASSRRPSFASGLARRVAARITGRGWTAAERSAAREDQLIDRALARHARGRGSAEMRAEARQWLVEADASPRLLEADL